MKRRSDFRNKIRQHPPLDLAKACKLAGIRIKDDPAELRISSTFKVLGDGNPGLLLFTVLGLFLGIAAILEPGNIYFKVFFGIIFFGLALFCIIAIISRFTNYCRIRGTQFVSNNSFKTIKFFLIPGCTVFMLTSDEYIKINQPGSGSWHRMVEIFIKSPNSGKHRIIDFQVEQRDASFAIDLGNEIIRLIQKRLP